MGLPSRDPTVSVEMRRKGLSWLATIPGEITVFPTHVKCSGPILKEIVLWRYLQSWLTVAMKCLVMYS